MKSLSGGSRGRHFRMWRFELFYKAVEKQASGRQPRRAAFWKAQHIRLICEHLQKPHNAGSRREAPFFNTLVKGCGPVRFAHKIKIGA
jgi:hypothetical protein